MARIPKKVATRIAAGIRKYQKLFQAAKDRDINESDTVVILTDFLADVLGFDKYDIQPERSPTSSSGLPSASDSAPDSSRKSFALT